LNIHSHRYT